MPTPRHPHTPLAQSKWVSPATALLLPPMHTLHAQPPLPHGAAPNDSEHAEADAFFCFVDLLGEFRDHFCKQLVRAVAGAGEGGTCCVRCAAACFS
jgi:hypothetical protein